MTAKQYKKKRNGYHIASILLMSLTLLFYIIYGYVVMFAGPAESSIIKDIIWMLIPYGITAFGLLIICIFISNKLRTTVWMASVIIGTLLFGRYCLLITFALWIVDEYFLFAKYNKYKLRKEMAEVRDEVK